MISPGYNSYDPFSTSALPTWDPTTAFKAGGAGTGDATKSVSALNIGWGPYFGSDLLGVPQGDPNAIPPSQNSGGATSGGGGWNAAGQFVGALLGTIFGNNRATNQTSGEQRSCPQDYREGYHRDPNTCQWIANTPPKKNDWWLWALLALLVLLVAIFAKKG